MWKQGLESWGLYSSPGRDAGRHCSFLLVYSFRLFFSQLQSVCMRAQPLQSYPTLCNSMDCSPPSSSVHGILQARNTGVGCHALLPGIFLTQGLNSSLISTALASKFFITRATLEAPVYSILTSSLRRSTLLSPVLTK